MIGNRKKLLAGAMALLAILRLFHVSIPVIPEEYVAQVLDAVIVVAMWGFAHLAADRLDRASDATGRPKLR